MIKLLVVLAALSPVRASAQVRPVRLSFPGVYSGVAQSALSPGAMVELKLVIGSGVRLIAASPEAPLRAKWEASEVAAVPLAQAMPGVPEKALRAEGIVAALRPEGGPLLLIGSREKSSGALGGNVLGAFDGVLGAGVFLKRGDGPSETMLKKLFDGMAGPVLRLRR
jgi:hypothetical protein